MPRLLHHGEHRFALLVAGVGDHRELELGAVLGPDAVGALRPAGAVEQRLCLGLVEADDDLWLVLVGP